MGFDFSSENLSSQIPILSDKVYVSDFCVSNMDSHVIVSLVLSLNVLGVCEPGRGDVGVLMSGGQVGSEGA